MWLLCFLYQKKYLTFEKKTYCKFTNGIHFIHKAAFLLQQDEKFCGSQQYYN